MVIAVPQLMMLQMNFKGIYHTVYKGLTIQVGLGYKQNNQMENFDIEASLRKVDRRFTDELDQEEKEHVIRQFKRIYAEEMAKLAGELSKKNKVQENLHQIEQREIENTRGVDGELKKRMERHNKNREKVQESKQKEHKLVEENWKRKFEEIMQKNKRRERQACHKAEKMRKDNEAYWTKKSETVNTRDASLKVDRRNETQKPYTEVGHHYKEFEMYNETQYGNRVSFPDVSKGKLNRVDFGNNKGLNRSVAESSLNDEIRSHQERSLKGAKDEETDKIKKYLEKIDKIQRTRRNAQEKVKKDVTEAKRLRELRENPETLAENRRKSKQQYAVKESLRGKKGSMLDLSNSRQKQKESLDSSILHHLESKKRLNEEQFDEREYVFDLQKKKTKQIQINRLVRDAINLLKHRTLKDTTE